MTEESSEEMAASDAEEKGEGNESPAEEAGEEAPYKDPKKQIEDIADKMDESIVSDVGLSKDSEIVELQHKFMEQLHKYEAEIVELKKQNTELLEKVQVVEEYSAELMQDTIKAGIRSRGNQFNTVRYEKYLKTLSIKEIKEELQMFKQEFMDSMQDNRKSLRETEDSELKIPMDETELRQEAAKSAMQEWQVNKSLNLAELTKQKLIELSKKR